MQAAAVKRDQTQGSGVATTVAPSLGASLGVVGRTAQAKGLQSLQQRLNPSAGDQAPVQLARYERPFGDGPPLDIEVVYGDGQLTAVDATGRGANGYLKYQAGGQGAMMGVWTLTDFKASPAGSGLGSLLLYQFALFAIDRGCHQIWVSNPAISAMGAYRAMGAVIRNQQVFDETRQIYAESSSALPDDEHSEDPQIRGRYMSGKTQHGNMVDGEAKELAELTRRRQQYLHPDTSVEALDEIETAKYNEWVVAHPYGEAERNRYLDNVAMSATLMFDPFTVAANGPRGWVPKQEPQPQPKSTGLFSTLKNLFK